MDICPAHSFLLGRPWIHGAGAVTSTLHKKLKYPVKGKIVNVCGEEEFMVSHLNLFKYVEMDVEFIKTPCQAFEVVSPMVAAAKATPDVPKVVKYVPRMASLKDARVVIEDGGCTIWGQLPDIPFKSDKCGFGFTAKSQKEVRCPHIGKPRLRISNHEVNALEDYDNDCDFDDWIYPTFGEGLNNWSAKYFIPISFNKEQLPFTFFIHSRTL